MLIMIMKKFEILQQLPKCDTETRSEQMLWEKKKMMPIDLLDAGLPQTSNLQKIKINKIK